jgi:hypothetical protein
LGGNGGIGDLGRSLTPTRSYKSGSLDEANGG